MNRILVDIEEGTAEPAWLGNVEPFMQKILEKLEKDGWELSVLFCSDSFIKNLNNEYREIDSPTDILSFEDGDEYIDDEGEKWISAGDIAISIETFMKNAEEFGVPADEELKRLLIHGILHLSGMDHGEAHIGKDRNFEGGSEEDKKMLEKQERLLAELNSAKLM